MGVLYLIRHGQASFGTDDYDRLSDLGHEQSRFIGRHLGRQGLRPARIVHGQMLRQRQTAEGILSELDLKPDAEIDPGWNEFNAWELTGALGEIDPRAKHDSTVFQAELERGCARWAGGDFDTDYAETFSDFTSRIDGALDAVFQTIGSGESTIVVSSAGAISWTVARLLGGDFDQWMALNRVTINTGITKIISGRNGTSLISFNDHGHLPPADVTYR